MGLDFADAAFVVFHGPNAQGKTNLLEAIGCLATLKSFRTSRTRELIGWGLDQARVEGQVHDGQFRRDFELELSSAGRVGKVDGKSPRQLTEYFEGIRAVLFAPEHIGIVREGPEVRRRFIDRAAFTASASFLDVARMHRRLLDQKASLLRGEHVDPHLVEVFDQQLAVAGARLVARRRALIDELRAPFLALHERITGDGSASMTYRTALGEGSREELAARYLALLEEAREDELRRGRNLVGPQRDDLSLKLGDRPARAYASQGQARSLVLALKLAELVAARDRGARPIFLLDDLSSELDRFRTGNLVGLLEELSLQVFVTTTDPSVVLKGCQGRVRSHSVSQGRVSLDEAAGQAP